MMMWRIFKRLLLVGAIVALPVTAYAHGSAESSSTKAPTKSCPTV